jgi:hypothetical protein
MRLQLIESVEETFRSGKAGEGQAVRLRQMSVRKRMPGSIRDKRSHEQVHLLLREYKQDTALEENLPRISKTRIGF